MAVRRPTARQACAGTAVAALAVAAFAVGWRQDDPARRAGGKPITSAAEWKVPQPKPADLAADAKIVLAKQPFGPAGERALPGAAAGADAGKGAAAQWRIGGIVTTERSRYLVVLMRQPGQSMDHAELRQVGENLPDGGTVRSVDPSSVTIDREGTVVTLRMFEKN